LPKHMAAQDQQSRGGFDIEFIAWEGANDWRVSVDKPGDYAHVEAFAMTYCVFVGGDAADPLETRSSNTRTRPRESGTWTVID
jgi:hypothetical protein